ncbi:MAG: DUF2079 domain-containing protein [Anaerolineae bacterium]
MHSRAVIFLLVGVIVVYTVLFSILSVARYNAFHTSNLDLGIIAQVTWNTAHGRWFETSVDRATNTDLIGSHLGIHVQPILLFLALLYRLWPDPRLLLILQSVALGIAALPLYYVIRLLIEDVKTALIVACCYLAYPPLGFLNLVDFHPVALSVPLLFLAYWALLKERFLLFWVTVLLVLFVRDELAVPIGIWGILNLLQRRRRYIGLGLVTLAGGWAALCYGFIVPHFNEGLPYRFWQLWAHLPGFPAQPSVQGGAAQPVSGASPEATILFLIHLFLPLGFLPFLGLSVLVVALPSLTYLLLGKRPALHSVGYHYPAVLIPWFFLAVGEGLRRVVHMSPSVKQRRLYRIGLAFLVIGTIGTNVPLNPIFLYAQHGDFRPDPYQAQIEEALALIPPDAGVATVNRFGPQLANRRVLVALEYPAPLRLDHVQMADYVLLDLVDCRVVPASNPRAQYAEIVAQVLQTGSFRMRYWSGRILLLERGVPVEEETAAILDYVSDLVERDCPCWP